MMPTMNTRHFIAAAMGVLLIASTASAGPWAEYRSEKYGFSMLVPEGTRVTAKDLDDGWAAGVAEKDGVTLWGIARLGAATKAQIEAFGVTHTGIAAAHWSVIDSGENANGFSWFKTAYVTDGTNALVAVYGVGPRASYLLILATTVADYERNKTEYTRWYKNLRAF